MASVLNCCNSCSETETVNIPGVEGAPGVDGINGINAYTLLTADLTIPAIAATVLASVTSSVWMVIGQVLIIGEGIVPSDAPNGWANFQVTAIPDATSVTLTYLGYTGDTATGEVLATNATVSPAGLIGP